jgi:asparagine synthase (glutamine-hydrolysing)
MCGIAGLIDRDAEARNQRDVADIEHRGRDDEGVWTSARSTNRRSRLFRSSAAVDHRHQQRGHQPMISHERFVVILNGEIYNYRELRDELTAKVISLELTPILKSS